MSKLNRENFLTDPFLWCTIKCYLHVSQLKFFFFHLSNQITNVNITLCRITKINNKNKNCKIA